MTLNLSSNMAGNSCNETNILPKLLLINTQVLRLCKAFANNSSAKLLRTRLHKVRQPREFLGRLLGPLLKTD